jgi:hypothetical protein
VAVGYYAPTTGTVDGVPFVVTEVNGTWGTPTALDASGLGSVVSLNVNSLSCPEAGECTIIGSYTPSGTAASPAPLAVDESAGAWGSCSHWLAWPACRTPRPSRRAA